MSVKFLDFFKTILLPLLMGITGWYSVYWANDAETNKAENTRISILYERLDKQAERLTEQDAIIAKLRDEVTRLRIQLAKRHENGKSLRSYLKHMPSPGWIKTTNIPSDNHNFKFSPRIQMWFINPAYEKLFNVTDAKYKGLSDAELGLWPKEVHESFRKNDLKTLRLMSGHCQEEKFPTRESKGKLVKGYVCKWVTEINGYLAIAGQIQLK